MLKAANPMLFGSSAATTNRAKTNGMIRMLALRIALLSMALTASAGLAVILPQLQIPRVCGLQEYTPRTGTSFGES